MRDRWYSDKRDLVKWGSLLYLAQERGVKAIVQVAFYRPDSDRLRLHKDDKAVGFPSAVLQHFRDLGKVSRLAETTGVQISVFKEEWPGASRQQYVEKLCRTLEGMAVPMIVFLDPDTGIAPRSSDVRHVRSEEIRTVFNSLKQTDWLAFYQHARRQKNWAGVTRREFANALRVPAAMVHEFSCADLAKNVRLFAVRK